MWNTVTHYWQQVQTTQNSMVSRVREINKNTAAMTARITTASSSEISNFVSGREESVTVPPHMLVMEMMYRIPFALKQNYRQKVITIRLIIASKAICSP